MLHYETCHSVDTQTRQAARYGITNEALIGLLFLPAGLGNTSELSLKRVVLNALAYEVLNSRGALGGKNL